MLWEVAYRQPRSKRIPHDYVQYDTIKMRWLVNRLPALDKYLNRLRESGCIRLIDDARDGVLIRLTEQGSAVLIRQCLARKAKVQPSRKSEVCILSFDVPERYRADRLALRKLLKIAKFKNVHKSTWVGQPQLVSHLLYFIRRQKLESYVRIYFGKEKLIH